MLADLRPDEGLVMVTNPSRRRIVMNRKLMRVTLLLAAVCLTILAVAPEAQACFFPCTTEGETMYLQDGCCNIGLFGPTYRLRQYICHSGCFQRTNTFQCTNEACI
jgi:hypothetical protein